MVPTKEAPTGNAPMGVTPLKAVTNRFLQVGGNRISEAPKVVFDPNLRGEGLETPPPNDSSKASLSPPVGGRLRSFRRDWQTNRDWIACLNRENGHLHKRPFQFHLKEHWRYPQSLVSFLSWTETISAHLE